MAAITLRRGWTATLRRARLRFTVLALALALALLAMAPAARALTVAQIRVEGVESALLDNIEARLDLARMPEDRSLTEAMLAYQLRQVPLQVSRALEPFGYYDATVEIISSRQADRVSLRLVVATGEPVRITARDVQLIGAGADDTTLQPLLKRFRPRVGQVLRHARYEASKSDIERGLLERGYFQSRGERAEVRVERASKSAQIDLAWRTGPRFNFGPTTISGSHLRPGLLEPLIRYREGEPYSQPELLRLQRALVELDYFGLIDIQPDLRALRGEAGAGGVLRGSDDVEDSEDAQDAVAGAEAALEPTPEVPILVSVTPAKRSRYSAGVSFGTDNGAALRLGLDRRWVNERGHKLKADAELGQRRSQIGVQYRIPEFEWLPGWWTTGISVREEEIGGSNSQIGVASVARSARWRGNQLSAELNAQSERFEQVELLRRVDRDTFLVFPALRIDRVDADDLLYPSRGYSLSAYVRAGSTALGSDIDFAQVGVSGRWIRGLGDRYRVLVRGEVASTRVDDFLRLPPSLRNYAGGDRSVRGYGYQELAPLDPFGEPAGARHLAVASAEIERRIGEQWAVAAFVDAGNAFDSGAFEPAVGVGLGLRWRSPVGPVRIDLGHGLDDPNRAVRIHIGIGPEL